MRIEKINENQIRCILSRSDLEERRIKLSELAYGSEKARSLFRDMMQQAFRDFGFEVNNFPLMIEAVPVSGDQLVLIITKVEDPEELDTRFSRFSAENVQKEDLSAELTSHLTGADDVLSLLRKLSEARGLKTNAPSDAGSVNGNANSTGNGNASGNGNATGKPASGTARKPGRSTAAPAAAPRGAEPTLDGQMDEYTFTRFYLFRDLDGVIAAARSLSGRYQAHNALFKNPEDGAFYLLLRKEDTAPETFNQVCNIMAEYSMPMDYTSGMEEFFREHMKLLIPDQAVQQLAAL